MTITLALLIFGIIVLICALVIIVLSHQKEYKGYRACVINLARRRDRMIEFGKHYTLPVKYELVDAVDGRELSITALVQEGVVGETGLKSIKNTQQGIPKSYHYELGSIGAVGCSLSHIKIWEKMVKEEIPIMFVFEDDAWVFGVNMDNIINRLEDLPADWHIYMIGQPHTVLEGLPVVNKKNLYRLTRFCGTHAYIINLAGAKWLIKYGRLFPIEQQIDAHLSELGWDHGFNIYMHLHEPLIAPFGGDSDIQVYSDKATFERFRLS